MSHSRTSLRIAGWGGQALVVSGLLVTWNLRALVGLALTPRVAFDAEEPPPAPDYADPASWSALPERADSADRAPDGSRAIDQRHAGVDAFYVHPTSYLGRRWNAPTDDAALNEATDRVATGIQAAAFNGCCAVYAPRYRRGPGAVPRDVPSRILDWVLGSGNHHPIEYQIFFMNLRQNAGERAAALADARGE